MFLFLTVLYFLYHLFHVDSCKRYKILISIDESSSTNDAYKQRSEDARAKTDAANRKLKVQFWSDTHWVDASHISGANANRIGIELDRVSKQRPGKRVRCIDVETGNVVDIR